MRHMTGHGQFFSRIPHHTMLRYLVRDPDQVLGISGFIVHTRYHRSDNGTVRPLHDPTSRITPWHASHGPPRTVVLTDVARYATNIRRWSNSIYLLTRYQESDTGYRPDSDTIRPLHHPTLRTTRQVTAGCSHGCCTTHDARRWRYLILDLNQAPGIRRS